jgi:cytochrome c biogenesis protein CcmG, thiol:disulfide interchange protein DsbE
MRRFLVPGLFAGAAVALIVLLSVGINSQGENTSIDAQVTRGHDPLAPSLSTALPVLGSSARASLASFHGQVVVMNIFASWCEPCKAEAPVLEREQQTLRGQGATVLGVTYLDNSDDSAAFVRAHHLTYPVLRDIDGKFVRSFGTNAVPETFVLNRNGRVAAVRRYVVDRQWLAQATAKALGRVS